MDFTECIQTSCLVVISHIPFISVWVKNPRPSNVSGMDHPLGQKSYPIPFEENGGLSRWADHTPMVTYSLSPLDLSPHHPHVLSLTLDIHIFIILMISYIFMYWFSNFASLSPAFIFSFPRALTDFSHSHSRWFLNHNKHKYPAIFYS